MDEPITLVAYCGLYCGDCFAHKGVIADMARDLRKELRAAKFDRTAAALADIPYFSAYKHYPECYDVLGALVKFRCKRGCRAGGGPPSCKPKVCCQKKTIDGCWECADFETCQKLEFLRATHGDAHIKNLRKLKKSGVDAFVSGTRHI